jgi:acetyl/propionyl-CoA carboxylase alpha subunit
MQTLLVANRGEIACRVIRSARRLGLSTIAVYSEVDRNALHVALADRAMPIGPAAARDSYLRADRLLEAARAAGADAIHPGYGFLAENAAFAEQVQSAGLHWIGASPQSIRDMGDKQRAREIAVAAGVPVLPGSRRFDDAELTGIEAAGADVGYPLLVKASAGGGGIGMRRVDAPAQLREAAVATQSMAARTFGDGAIYLERYVPVARHVEVQVFGFGDGRTIHLFERDCSLQRRFQKVIEESRAPGLPPAVAIHMADAATRLCAEQRYEGAGTVEFIVDAGSFEFFFLEMNTRIQVEHPVTEMITGRDLVAMQIELARGTLSPIAQAEIAGDGAAIELRLYAENPARNFLPSPGLLDRFDLPPTDAGLRIDSGYRAGDAVSTFYDPLLAKVICHAHTREAAIDRLQDALVHVRVEGLQTNQRFLAAVLGHPEFRAGRVDTGFIERHKASLLDTRAGICRDAKE